MSKNKLEIEIGGDASGAKKAGEEAAGSIESLKKTAESATKLAAIGFGLVTAALVKGIAAYKEQEQAVNQLNQSLVQQGIFTRELSKDYQKQAAELQKLTAFGDEAIIKAQAKLQAYLGETKITKELTAATLDYAAATGKDLKAAVEAVGKSIGTAANPLKEFGIELSKNATVQEKLQAVTEGLTAKVGGQAAAAAQGLGSIEQLNNAIGDLFEIIGKSAAPLVGLFTGELLKLADSTEGVTSFANILGSALEGVADIAALTAGAFEKVGGTIGVVLATAFESGNALLEGQFKRAAEIAGNGASAVAQVLEESDQRYFERKEQIYGAREAAEAAALQKEEMLIAQSEVNKESIRQAAADKAAADAVEAQLLKQDQLLLDNQMIIADEDQKIQLRMDAINKQLAVEEDFQKRKGLIAERGALVEKKIILDKAKFEEEQNKLKLDAAKETFGGLSTLTRTGNKKLFEIGKAAAIASAVVNTAQAVTKALSQYPPPFSFAAAAAQGVAGAVQISAIQAQGLNQGGVVAGFTGTPGKDSVPGMLTPGELIVPNQNFDEVINAVAQSRISSGSSPGASDSGQSMMQVVIGFTDDAFQIIEQKLVERRAIGVGII